MRTHDRRLVGRWALTCGTVLTLSVAGGGSAQARQAASGTAAQRETQTQISKTFIAPETPAFTFLSASPSKITEPGTTRDFGAALLDAIDESGHVRQGVALAASLHGLGLLQVPLDQYQSSWLKRALYRAELSIGTSRAQGDSASTDVATGLRLTLFDRSDPIADADYARQLGAAMSQAIAPGGKCAVSGPGGNTQMQQQCLGEIVRPMREEWLAKHWNAPHVILAAAGGVGLDQSRINDAGWIGQQVWLSAALPVMSRGRITGLAEVSQRRPAPDSSYASLFSYGLRGVFGGPTFNLFAEVLGRSELGSSSDSDLGGSAWSGGVEFRAADNVWISTGFGEGYSSLSNSDQVAILANIRWAVSRESRFNN